MLHTAKLEMIGTAPCTSAGRSGLEDEKYLKTEDKRIKMANAKSLILGGYLSPPAKNNKQTKNKILLVHYRIHAKEGG